MRCLQIELFAYKSRGFEPRELPESQIFIRVCLHGTGVGVL